jgi:hypothetical protein
MEQRAVHLCASMEFDDWFSDEIGFHGRLNTTTTHK